MHDRSSKTVRRSILSLASLSVVLLGTQCPGLNFHARQELKAAGVDKYLGQFTPSNRTDIGDGWVRHDFDSDGGDGPICIDGSAYAVFSLARNPHKLLILEQGGGACWTGSSFCIRNVGQNPVLPPIPPGLAPGLWDFDNSQNPFAGYSIVYLPYCDGSVWSGDNDVADPSYPDGVRRHRGLRNQSAGLDVAHDLFPHAVKITGAGSSAGGSGIARFAPFLIRFLWGNWVDLTILNDAGPVASNLDDIVGITARANDWLFGQFYPASCTDCSDTGQPTAVIDWRLANDRTIREAFYSTDQDSVIRQSLGLPAEEFRDLLVAEHGALHDAYPKRYKAFIVSEDDSHTAIQKNLLYTQEANGTPLFSWVWSFVNLPYFWQNIVEDFVPLP
jgi:hypothetical protein